MAEEGPSSYERIAVALERLATAAEAFVRLLESRLPRPEAPQSWDERHPTL